MAFRARRLHPLALLVAAVLAGALFAPSASAGPAEDVNAMIMDFANDGDISACAFTKAQLDFLRSQITQDIDDYAPDLRLEVNREIARWTSGGCGSTPGAGETGGQVGNYQGAHRATIKSLKMAKNFRSVKVKLRCPTAAASSCRVTLRGKLAGKTATMKKVATVARGASKTVTLKLTSKARQRLSATGGKLKVTAKTAGSTLAAASRTLKIAP
ncbi:MAG: hypothetical protein ACRDKY_05565 [Solirubrobacteraceae bacterium]